ncbi:hypothetical protein [Spongorhabdus nitratireducens]
MVVVNFPVSTSAVEYNSPSVSSIRGESSVESVGGVGGGGKGAVGADFDFRSIEPELD